MPITYEDVSESFRRIALSGRLDIPGTDEIATKFAALSATGKRRVVVDLTGISFLSSIGIRALLSSAKALLQKDGRMVLFVGGKLIPMFADPAEAEKAALA
jgi:anti-anti-sigma factor